ncbi:hypothetical protein D6D13_10355 [Aureobasidium pullulans]|uniref:Uncharacterized protein n=1 Tax=Aureobasidium pullulans TaxID=5580 RepID=A0A4S9BYK6_AURPU|nr:hypothetical protein D6D13_10355 [Aureobasidium pullulans]
MGYLQGSGSPPNPVVGLAVQSLKRLRTGYDAIDNAFYIAQAWASNMLRAQGRHVRIKIDDNASPRFAAVRPGVALRDLVIDLPSPRQLQTSSPTEQTSSVTSQQPLSMGTTSTSPQRLLNRERSPPPSPSFSPFASSSSVESSALVTQNRSRPIANYTMRNVKMHARLPFGHSVPRSWKDHIEEISMSSSVDLVLVGNLWTPRCFEDIDPNLPQQPKVKHFEAIDQWSVQFDLDRLVAETE